MQDAKKENKMKDDKNEGRQNVGPQDEMTRARRKRRTKKKDDR